MKNLIRSTVVSLVFFSVSMVYGIVPVLSVTVSDASGKAAYKGMTNGKGTFATGTLKPGGYVVQFNSKSAGSKGSHYALVVSAGAKKVVADSVAAEKFAAGGVAMKIDVGSGLNITGQVAAESSTSTSKNGKKLVWIPKQLGSNMPGHWAEADSAEAKQAKTAGSMSTQNIQDRQNQSVSPGN